MSYMECCLEIAGLYAVFKVLYQRYLDSSELRKDLPTYEEDISRL